MGYNANGFEGKLDAEGKKIKQLSPQKFVAEFLQWFGFNFGQAI